MATCSGHDHSMNDNTEMPCDYSDSSLMGPVEDWFGGVDWEVTVDSMAPALIWKLYKSMFIRDQSVRPVAAASLQNAPS